jgi:hypothetical protein
MKHILAVILWTYLIGHAPDLLFTGYDSWYMALYVRDMQCALWVALVFNYIPSSRIRERTSCLAFLVYVVTEAQLYYVNTIFSYDAYQKSYLIYTILITVFFSYQLFKRFNYKSDPIDDFHNIYLCWWKPKTSFTLSVSLLGLPFGGLSIYSRGILHGFKWNEEKYQAREVSPKVIQKNFIVQDTGIRMNSIIWSKLFDLKYKKAGKLRIRCITTILPVLKEMGSHFTPKNKLEYIPCKLSARLLK